MQMVLRIKAHLSIIYTKVKEHTSIPMVHHILEIGLLIKKMVRVYIQMPVVGHMMVNGKLELKKVMAL